MHILGHTVYQIEYHFVWITEYRYIAGWVRDLVRQTCETFEIRIIRGAASKDMSIFWSVLLCLWQTVKS